MSKTTGELIAGDFHHESDRGIVLVAVAALDEIVTTQVASHLSHGNKQTLDRLLVPPMGSISSFMSKVNLAYCLGLHSAELHHDIVLFNKLRNYCAHNWSKFSATDDVLHKYIHPLNAYRPARAALDYFRDKEPEVYARSVKGPRGELGMTATMLISITESSVAVPVKAQAPSTSGPISGGPVRD